MTVESTISEIDASRGRLSYRGHSIHDLAGEVSFEEAAYLLLYQHIPRRGELISFSTRLAKARTLPLQIVEIIKRLRNAQPMSVLRTAVSALAAVEEQKADRADRIDPRERLIARIPTIFATQQALRIGASLPVPNDGHGFSKNLLATLGLAHDDARVRLTDMCLLTQAEHGTSASAFAARIAVRAHADVYAAVSAAIGAFDGGMQGCGTGQVLATVRKIGVPEKAQEYLRACRKKQVPVLGFAERAVGAEDPRVRHVKTAAYELAAITGRTHTLRILEALDTHGADIGLRCYTAAFYEQLGLPDDLFTPLSAAARVSGWLAHIDEESGVHR